MIPKRLITTSNGPPSAATCASAGTKVALFQSALRRACACGGQHRLGQVDPGRRSIGAGTNRRLDRQGTVPAADVEDAIAGTDVGDRESPDPEGLEHLVEAVRLVDPLTGVVAVPVLALLRVRVRHDREPRSSRPKVSESLVHSS